MRQNMDSTTVKTENRESRIESGKAVRIKSWDAFKWLAAFLVVAIHTSPLESIWPYGDFLLTRIAARLAVPFFFMLTGYFTVQVRKTEKKLFLLYLGFKLRGLTGMILAVPVGLVFINFYKYGAFDSMIRNFRMLVEAIQKFRREE